jgi:peptidyl-prolyl cis-trans isomerase A (cyclophilin A)
LEVFVTESFDASSPFTVRFDCSCGTFDVECHPEWAPRGAERFHEIVSEGLLDDCRFFRVIEGFMVQFGIPGDPAVAAEWRSRTIDDDPVEQSNHEGYLTYACAGPDTRTTQMFINFKDNSFLDGQGFAPFGKVVSGMDVVHNIYKGYGEGAPQGNGPAQHLIQQQGNAYLTEHFPELDYIKSARIVAA